MEIGKESLSFELRNKASPQHPLDRLITDTLCVFKLESWSARNGSDAKRVSVLQCGEHILQLKVMDCVGLDLFVQSFICQAVRERKRLICDRG